MKFDTTGDRIAELDARNERCDERLAKYQDDFKRTLTAMRDTCRDIYKL